MTEGTGNTMDQAWAVLKRRKAIAAGLFVGAFVLAASVILTLPDMYRAGATVLINQGDVPDTFIRSPVSGESEPRLHTISQRVLSRPNLMELIDEFGLYPERRRKASPQALVDRMRRDVLVEHQRVDGPWGRGPTVSFVVEYQSFDPEVAAAVANRLATLYVEENDRLRARQASETSTFLRNQLENVKQRLDEQEGAINEYRERRLGELPEQQVMNLSTLDRLHGQLRLNGESQLRAMERRRELVRQMDAEGVSSADGGGRLSRLRAELADARARFSDRHPDVIRLQAELANLERQAGNPAARDGAAGPLQRQLAQIDGELEGLRREETRLRQSALVYESRIENVPRREQELAVLTRDYQVTREQYGSLLERYEEATLAETLERQQDHQFQVLDPAVAPETAAAPQRMRLLAMALVLALIVGGCGVALAEQLDTSFHSMDDLRGFTGVPVVAGIPRIATFGDVARSWVRVSVSAVLAVGLVALVAIGGYAFGSGNMDLVLLLGGRG